MARFVVVFTVIIGCALAFPQPQVIDENLDWRIVGGSTASAGQFPHQVSLRKGNSHFCGGSILSTNWVLTAAHCVDSTSASAVTIVVGTNTLNAGGTKYQASRLVIHSAWNSQTLTDDIALVRSASAIALGGNVKTIAMGNSNVGAGVAATVSGWGQTSHPGSIPNNLQYVSVKTLSVADCQQKLSPNPVRASQVCTFSRAGQGVCFGDSGGPLISGSQQIGVVSWVIPCAKGHPDVFTRVSSYITWINQNAN